MNRLIFFSIIFFVTIPFQGVEAYDSPSTRVESLDGFIDFELSVGDEAGGSSIAIADLGSDGISEIIIGGGIGSEPRVRVLRQDGSEIGSFLAYASTLLSGITLVACDVTGDGYNEIITAPQRGGGPHVRIFNRYGKAIDDGGFFAYEETFRAGVNLACGDLNGDDRAELVTLPAAGGGPHVRVWSMDGTNAQLVENFFAFHASDRSGLVGDINDKKLYLAQQHTSSPTLKTIVIHSGLETENEQLIDTNTLGLTSLFVHEGDVYVSSSTNGELINVTDASSQTLHSEFGSVVVASDGERIVYTQTRPMFTSNDDAMRIVVDISEQRLYAYEMGILVNTFLISSGLNDTTPIGEHTVLAKIPEVHYAWTYGENDPRNYDLGWIPYNLRIFPHIYIHYAPWHNNFGHKMSHGCVNVSLKNIQWVYAWAQTGIPVVVQE